MSIGDIFLLNTTSQILHESIKGILSFQIKRNTIRKDLFDNMVAKNSAKGGKQEPQEIRQDSLINLISAEAETYLPDINTNLGPFVLHFCNFPVFGLICFCSSLRSRPTAFGWFGFFKGFVISLPWMKGTWLLAGPFRAFGTIKFYAPMHGNKCRRYNFGQKGLRKHMRKNKFEELSQH